jgi:predicted TIM-barrel fold metal-dependent hydrolase
VEHAWAWSAPDERAILIESSVHRRIMKIPWYATSGELLVDYDALSPSFFISFNWSVKMSVEVQTRVVSAESLPTRKHIKITASNNTRAKENSTTPIFPNGGWDTHHHIFDPERFPYVADRHLTPPAASVQQFIDFKARLGLTNSVLTHGLSYGDDCTSLKTFVPELDRDKTSAVAVIDPRTVKPSELASMHHIGIRGIRVNLYKYGAMHDLDSQKVALREHHAALKEHCPGWSMAFTHIHPEFWNDLTPTIREIADAGTPVVTDHCALLKGASMLPDEYKEDVLAQPGLEAITSLVRSAALYVKISAPYRLSDLAPDFNDLRPIVRALVDANPEMILWGSDWPHTPRMKVRSRDEALQYTPFLQVDDEKWLRTLKSWLSEDEWDIIMIRNPSRLYGNRELV